MGLFLLNPSVVYRTALADATIDICHLNRRRLIARRRRKIVEITKYVEIMKDLESANQDQKAKVFKEFLLREDQTYAAVARAIITDPEAFYV